MTVEEIFVKLLTHMSEGVHMHCEIARAFDFVGLEGYSYMHRYHQCEEISAYIYLSHYYSCHYHKLIKEENIVQQNIIPEAWYKYTTMDVDGNTKKNTTKELFEKWIEWEQETKKLYCNMQRELYTIGEVAAALKINSYIEDVDKELNHAEKKYINLASVNYDLPTIVEWSEKFKEKYRKKLGW